MKFNKTYGGYVLKIAVGITMSALLLISMAGAIPVEEWNKTYLGIGSGVAASVQQPQMVDIYLGVISMDMGSVVMHF